MSTVSCGSVTWIIFLSFRIAGLELLKEMHYPFLILLISLTGAIYISDIADGLDNNQNVNNIRLQRRQDSKEGGILLNIVWLSCHTVHMFRNNIMHIRCLRAIGLYTCTCMWGSLPSVLTLLKRIYYSLTALTTYPLGLFSILGICYCHFKIIRSLLTVAALETRPQTDCFNFF